MQLLFPADRILEINKISYIPVLISKEGIRKIRVGIITPQSVGWK